MTSVSNNSLYLSSTLWFVNYLHVDDSIGPAQPHWWGYASRTSLFLLHRWGNVRRVSNVSAGSYHVHRGPRTSNNGLFHHLYLGPHSSRPLRYQTSRPINKWYICFTKVCYSMRLCEMSRKCLNGMFLTNPWIAAPVVIALNSSLSRFESWTWQVGAIYHVVKNTAANRRAQPTSNDSPCGLHRQEQEEEALSSWMRPTEPWLYPKSTC